MEPAIYFGVVNLSFIAYLDGREIYRFGEIEKGPEGFAGRPFHLVSLPDASESAGASEGKSRQRWLTLRIWSDFRNVGIDGGAPKLGCRADLQQNIVRKDMGILLIGVMAMAAGIAGLIIFVRTRFELVYLAFALLSCNVGIYMIGNRSMRLPTLLLDEPMLWYYAEHYSLYCLPVTLVYFFQKIAADSWPTRLVASSLTIMAAAFTICSLVWMPAYRLYGAFLYGMLAHAGAFIVMVPHALIKGPPEVRVIVAGILLFFMPGIGDIFWALGYIPGWPGALAPYGFLLLLLGMSVAVWQRYVRIQDDLHAAHQALEVYAKHLESIVEQRTSELQSSLDEVSRLKEQQDGDYLLISRVLGPMTSTTIDGEVIRVDSLVAQHKRFEFRGMAGELGGDLCMAQPVLLDGENYVAFMNADAMGKSVQGASGAIVLAVAFRAFLHLSADGQIPISGRPPVEWLLRLVEELQRVFRPFEGRMMVSLMMGVLHERTGRVYAINAGHPPAVLLRAGEARYVLEQSHDAIGSGTDDELSASGDDRDTPANHPPIAFSPESAIIEMQLLSGDTLLAGSDGRDDLRLKSKGRELIESDPARFLKIVAQCRGDLRCIATQLHAAGEQTDDLSLLRLSYRESDVAGS